jgi:hypothetical protein
MHPLFTPEGQVPAEQRQFLPPVQQEADGFCLQGEKAVVSNSW